MLSCSVALRCCLFAPGEYCCVYVGYPNAWLPCLIIVLVCVYARTVLGCCTSGMSEAVRRIRIIRRSRRRRRQIRRIIIVHNVNTGADEEVARGCRCRRHQREGRPRGERQGQQQVPPPRLRAVCKAGGQQTQMGAQPVRALQGGPR